GVDIVELSGNHNLDYGAEAYLNTLEFFRQNNIQTIGGGETLETARQPFIVEHHGNSIALLACNWAGPGYALATDAAPGAAYCDWDWLREALPQLAAEHDLLVVTVQYSEAVED